MKQIQLQFQIEVDIEQQKGKMETSSPSMATQTPADMSNGSVQQQHFSVQSAGTQAVSIVTQDPSKGVYIVDPSQQHATLQMFGGDQRLIAASSNQVELANTSNTSASAQTIVVREIGFLQSRQLFSCHYETSLCIQVLFGR